MAKDILTDREVRLAKPTAKEYLLSDGSGLHLRVRPNGAKDWLFVYTFSEKRRKMGLGSLGAVSLATVRQEANKIRAAVATGIDPQLQRRQLEEEQNALRAELEAARTRMTIIELFERWERAELVERKDKGAEVRRMFAKDVFPDIGDMAAEDVRKGHVMAIIDTVKQRGVSRMARVIFSLVRQMMLFAVDRELIESDPTSAIRKSKAVGKDAERDRVLSEDEIQLLCDKLAESGLTDHVKAAIWIMLSTCCRVGELSKAKWKDVDLEQRRWRIPPEVAKNESEHIIALSDFAASQFQILKQYQTSMTWVYPSRNGDKHLDEKTITKQIRDRQRTERLKGRAKPSCILLLPGGQWTSHDLRRSGATLMGELGVAGDVIERCLNHVEQNKIKRTYQRQRIEQAKADAWQLLGERLALLVTKQENVVAIKRKRPVAA